LEPRQLRFETAAAADTWTFSDLIEDDEDCIEMDGFAGKVSKNWDGTPGLPFIVWQQG
jgi:hypothetical protein